MDKVIKIYERPKRLPELILDMQPGGSLTIYATAFKTSQVRTVVSRINKKLPEKEFSVTDRGFNDRCIVRRWKTDLNS